MRSNIALFTGIVAGFTALAGLTVVAGISLENADVILLPSALMTAVSLVLLCFRSKKTSNCSQSGSIKISCSSIHH